MPSDFFEIGISLPVRCVFLTICPILFVQERLRQLGLLPRLRAIGSTCLFSLAALLALSHFEEFVIYRVEGECLLSRCFLIAYDSLMFSCGKSISVTFSEMVCTFSYSFDDGLIEGLLRDESPSSS